MAPGPPFASDMPNSLLTGRNSARFLKFTLDPRLRISVLEQLNHTEITDEELYLLLQIFNRPELQQRFHQSTNSPTVRSTSPLTVGGGNPQVTTTLVESLIDVGNSTTPEPSGSDLAGPVNSPQSPIARMQGKDRELSGEVERRSDYASDRSSDIGVQSAGI